MLQTWPDVFQILFSRCLFGKDPNICHIFTIWIVFFRWTWKAEPRHRTAVAICQNNPNMIFHCIVHICDWFLMLFFLSYSLLSFRSQHQWVFIDWGWKPAAEQRRGTFSLIDRTYLRWCFHFITLITGLLSSSRVSLNVKLRSLQASGELFRSRCRPLTSLRQGASK